MRTNKANNEDLFTQAANEGFENIERTKANVH